MKANNTEPRHTSLEVGDPPKRVVVDVSFCESSASVDIPSLKTVIHFPWSELAEWQAWLAARVEEGL